MSKCIAVLGATGSVGTQALDVARKSGYKVDFISANSDFASAERLAREFRVKYVAMSDEACAQDLRLRLRDTDITVLGGAQGILEGIHLSSSNTVVNSIIGGAGLMPTLAIIDAGKRLALANKESLVIAGDIVMTRAKENNVEIIPVDSEHSAIFQSLLSGKNKEIKKIILTASGGPFYGKTYEELKGVTLSDTLAHPTWKMGKKITVDSATLMNKGFEVIEAVHLFGVAPEKIQVVVHRQSILHSAVEYIDNSIIGEFSVPDMRMCVQYAVDYPNRHASVCDELDLIKLGAMTFAEPDLNAFPLLALAKTAIKCGGAMPCVVNAADEIAVEAFLQEKIGFTDIYDTVIHTFDKMSDAKSYTSLSDITMADKEARRRASEYVNK